ncbi:MAG: CBS domain-containing protein [Candidatus Woesearchaeota archaeon]|jgi:predicted transcriptional regulator|nr:CBS domain-containing protein [Candidatus Woesearchaeota archaeon]
MIQLKQDFTKNEILEVAREFKRRRNFLDISQLKLAKIANLSQSIVNKLENGKIDPTYSTILKIEKALSEQEEISNVKAESIMIKEIISVKPNCKIFNVLELMRKNDFSQLLVFKDNIPIGTIYEKTILDVITQKIDIYETQIKKFIEPNPIIVPPEYSASDLSYIFQNHKIKFVLVGKNNEVLGLITKSDLFKQ